MKFLKFIWPMMILVRKILNLVIQDFGDDTKKALREKRDNPGDNHQPK